MFITKSAITIIAVAIVIIMIVYGVVINIEAIVSKKSMNPKAMFLLMAIIAVGTLTLICNIDYSKSIPAKIYTNEDVTGAYNAGYDAGIEESYTTTEDWFANLQSVTIGIDDTTIHLIDSNGEEWILVSDDYQN